MAFVNLKNKEIQVKIVYYGPGRGGKTSNLEYIYKKFAKRSLILDEDQHMLDLKKGRNDLLLKLDQNKGAWEFSFRLPTNKIRSHKYKYYIVND